MKAKTQKRGRLRLIWNSGTQEEDICSTSQIPSHHEQKTLLLFSTPLRLDALAGVYSLRKLPDNSRIQLVLGNLDAGMEGLCCVSRKNGDTALSQDLAGIDSRVDEMDGATRLRHTGLHGLTPCLQPPEGR